jgi:2-polyprenyl-3-methyl-5-hydroxy-6-metoxy-1,4-benzoquinol methylase
MKSLMTCMLCGSVEAEELLVGIRHASDTSVKMCKGCGLVFLWPRPTEEELSQYYAGAYRKEYNLGELPAQIYQRGTREAQQRVERLKSVLKPSMSVLEVGANVGTFMKRVEPHVASVVGVEPGGSHRDWAARELGLTFVKDIAELGDRKFDLVVLFHTLEHVVNPVNFLRSLTGYLAPGGIMAIEVPNVNDALIALYKIPAVPPFYYHKVHLYCFSRETLARTIVAVGGRPDITGVQRYDLSNHLRWAITGQPGGQGYYNAVLGERVQTAYAEALIQAGFSDTLWATGVFNAEEKART